MAQGLPRDPSCSACAPRGAPASGAWTRYGRCATPSSLGPLQSTTASPPKSAPHRAATKREKRTDLGARPGGQPSAGSAAVVGVVPAGRRGERLDGSEGVDGGAQSGDADGVAY